MIKQEKRISEAAYKIEQWGEAASWAANKIIADLQASDAHSQVSTGWWQCDITRENQYITVGIEL